MARIAAGPASEERRQQIMDAAMRVFAEKGFTGATTKDIAHEAGVTPGLIYHYFEDKRAVFNAIFVEHSPLGGASSLLVTDGLDEIDPHILLPLLVTKLVSRLEGTDNGCAFKVMMGEALHDAEVKDILNAHFLSLVEALASYLRGQIERGRLRPLDPVLVAHMLLGSIVTCVFRRSLTGNATLNSYSGEQIAATMVDLMLGGLNRRPPATA